MVVIVVSMVTVVLATGNSSKGGNSGKYGNCCTTGGIGGNNGNSGKHGNCCTILVTAV